MTAAQVMLDSMNQEGIHPAAEIIDDGIFHRIDDANGKPGNKLIGYICFDTAGYFCHWSILPEGMKIHVKGNAPLSDEERRDYAVKIQLAKVARAKADQERRQECRERSADIWAISTDGDGHPYLIAKGIEAHGARIFKGRLVIRVFNLKDELVGLQYITKTFKWFEDGTPVKGNFGYILGDKNLPLFICEGFATGSTIHEATGSTVFVSFSCGNLLPVAESIRAVEGTDRTIVICADNDRFTAGNPGLTHATAAAAAVGGLLAVPQFPGDEGTDFNDLMQIVGDVLGGEKC